MKTYILVDFMNMAHRAKNVTFNSDLDTQIGNSMQIIFNSIKKVNNLFGADHAVVCTEGSSWRKKYDPKYKQNRVMKQISKPIEEQEDDKIFMEAMNDLESFIAEKTNITVLNNRYAEADDMIAFFIQCHPEDRHYIISGDTDYIQLLTDKVFMYNGVSEELLTVDGYFKINGKQAKDSKGNIKVMPDPKYALFEKCIRGDSSDNVFTAYPRVRTKGTKNKVGIMEAFADMENKGYDWNNFMQTKYTDHEGEEQLVLERYEANRLLIDLTMQPEYVKEACLLSMADALASERVSGVGINFLKFCNTWNLVNLAKFPDEIANILNKSYVL